MDTRIEELKHEIRKVQQEIDDVEGQLTKAAIEADAIEANVAYWRKEKDQLRKAQEQLREEELLLREEKLLLLKAATSGTPKKDNTLSIRKHIVGQRVHLCNVDELQGLLRTELEELEAGLRFPVTLNMWNFLPTNRDKLFKLAGPDEECFNISLLVNAIVNPPMPAITADTEASFTTFGTLLLRNHLSFSLMAPG